jgi:chromosome segregation ATPase
VFAEEKAALEEERDELTAHVDDLSKFNSQLAVEVENMRSQAKATASSADADIDRLNRELDHMRGEMARLQSIIDGGKRQADELEDIRAEHQRLQQQNARTEASLKEKMASLDSSRQMIKWSNSLLEAEKKKVTEAEQALSNAEHQYREMEETWRQQMMDNSNKLVALNNQRLEDQAAQYQGLIAEEQEKQKAMRERVKKARSIAAKSAQKYDEMVLENEVLMTQFEQVKTEAMKMFRDQQRAATEETSDNISAMIRGQRRDLDAFGGGGGARPQSAYRR